MLDPVFLPVLFIPNLINPIERVSSVCENRLIQAHGILDGVEGIDNILSGDSDLGGNLGDGRLLLVLF